MHSVKYKIAIILAAAGLVHSAAAQVVINEVFENPPESGDEQWEYVELYGPPGFNLSGYAVALVKGGEDQVPPFEIPDGALNQKSTEIDEAFSLDGWTIGSNGFFVIYNSSSGGDTALLNVLVANPPYNATTNPTGFKFWEVESPTNKRFLNGAAFDTVHIPSVEGADNLANDGSSTYLLVRRRPLHSLNNLGRSVYATGYAWKKDVTPDVDFNSYLDFGNEHTLGVPIYLADGLNDTQTTALQLQPVQIVDEIAWSNAGGREYNISGRGDNSGKLLESPGYNPDTVNRFRYLGANPRIGSSINESTLELGYASIADESWSAGETLNVVGGSTYGTYKLQYDSEYEDGVLVCEDIHDVVVCKDGIVGTADDELTYRAPTNPLGPTYSYDGPGDLNPLAAPFFEYSGALDPLGTLLFNPYDLTGYRVTPGAFNDAPAGTPLASIIYSLQTTGDGAQPGRQFRFIRGDFNFDNIVNCLDRGFIARAVAEGWTLDDTATFVNDNNTIATIDDTTYTGYKRQITAFNSTLAMIRMSLTDGSTGEWNSASIVDTNASSPTFNRIIAWGGVVTAQDLAAFDAAFPALAGSVCGSVATGACCTSTLCTVVSAIECVGEYLGDGNVCQATSCTPVGACCTGLTCEVVLFTECQGAFLGDDRTCTPTACLPRGACCTGETCRVTFEADCGGHYFGDGTTCNHKDICDRIGACCTPTGCQIMEEDNCLEAGGTYNGDYTDCSTNPCCPADFNGDNTRDVADLFAYINAWLAKTSAADFNDSGSVDVADLFAYINAWLAGC